MNLFTFLLDSFSDFDQSAVIRARLVAMASSIRGFLLILVSLWSPILISSLYEDQVGLMDWRQEYIGKVKHAVFHTQKAGRKRVIVSTEENVVASLDLRHGKILWRHVLGASDRVDELGVAFGKFVLTLSSDGGFLRAWNLPDGQMTWESFVQGSGTSRPILSTSECLNVGKDNFIFVYSGTSLHAISSIGEVIWAKAFGDKKENVKHIANVKCDNKIYVVGFIDFSEVFLYQLHTKSGEILDQQFATLPFRVCEELALVSNEMLVALDVTRSILTVIRIGGEEISTRETKISDLVGDFFGRAEIISSKLTGMFCIRYGEHMVLVKVSGDGTLEAVKKMDHHVTLSDVLTFAEGKQAFAVIQHEGKSILLTVREAHVSTGIILKETIDVDDHRGFVHKVFINNYIRTDRSHGFRALIVMNDHSLLLVQQGEIVWKREDGLASIIGTMTSELPVEKKGAAVAKVENSIFEFLKVHMLRLKGTLMLASPEELMLIQEIKLRSSEKTKMTRDHNGFRQLLIVLTKAGKIYALHTGDGRIIWSFLPPLISKLSACGGAVELGIYPWQTPHHHAMDVNPSVLIIGRCRRRPEFQTIFSIVDTYTGRELYSQSLSFYVAQVISLPLTDSKEQQLYLLVDTDHRSYLYPQTPEALDLFRNERPNIYWYAVETDTGTIKGHGLKDSCHSGTDGKYCFVPRDLWSVIFPLETERIITTATRNLKEVVHTQAKVIADQDVMYKYISKNFLFVATVSPKGAGKIGSASPEDSWLVVYLIDTVTGRILHRVTHLGSQGPVYAVLSENWIVYHYFNLRAHRHEMSVIEIYDQSRADNKDVWKLVIGKHNLTFPITSYSRPEVITKSQSYFFPYSVKEMAVTSTAKGITSKQLLVGTINDQILAIDKRFLDPSRSSDPLQSEREGTIPLTDSLPINTQSYVTHSYKVEGLRGILTVPAKLESTTLFFAHGVDLFFTRISPSRTYDSLTEDFSYVLLLITILALLVAIVVTWILSEKKELQERWR